MNNLDKLFIECKSFTSDPMCVYKKCVDMISDPDPGTDPDRKWLVILRKLPDTKTNEKRQNVINPKCAKFRANKLKVIKIINVDDPSITKKHILNKFNNNELCYRVGDTVISDLYDENINVTCSHGIHYFKTIRAAYFYESIPTKHCGKWIEWHDNGNKSETGEYLNGKQIGSWISWYDNGTKNITGNYLNGEKNGKWTQWYDSGNKREEGAYLNGERNGRWIFWNKNGKKSEEHEYLNDRIKRRLIYR